MQHRLGGGFTSGLRPKARVRPSTADDLAVIDADAVTRGWILGSSAAACLIPECGYRQQLGPDDGLNAAGLRAHRDGCRA